MPTSDFSDKYNTPVPPQRQAEYQSWRAALPHNLQNQHDYDLQGAFLNGSDPDPRAHLTDQFKKPNHSTFSDGSQYNGIDGYVGGKWSDAGYKPSQTNLQFRPQEELQNYFNEAEPGTKLLQADPMPVPTGKGGVLTVGDLSGTPSYRVKPPAAITPDAVLAPQPRAPRRFYGQ